ncbi:MAG TPA: hypothetical protein PLV42_01145 [bacterium]|nr:hypothetical protein [bacterium]
MNHREKELRMMLDLRERIQMAMRRYGILSFGALHELFPVQSVTHLAEVLHQMVTEGLMSKRIDIDSGATFYYRRFYTASGDHIIFHHRDHPHPERFSDVPFLQEMPWFFEPIEYNDTQVFSPNFADPATAIAAAEDREKEEAAE